MFLQTCLHLFCFLCWCLSLLSSCSWLVLSFLFVRLSSVCRLSVACRQLRQTACSQPTGHPRQRNTQSHSCKQSKQHRLKSTNASKRVPIQPLCHPNAPTASHTAVLPPDTLLLAPTQLAPLNSSDPIGRDNSAAINISSTSTTR